MGPVIQNRIVRYAGDRAPRIIRHAQNLVFNSNIDHALANRIDGAGNVQSDSARKVAGKQSST